MASAPPREPDRVVGRLRAAVAMRIATGPDANDASAALPVSPHVAWEAIDDAAVDARAYADRVAEAARLLDLDDLSVDVLWLSALAEFGARYGSVFAFLNEDATRRLPTPQLIASVLADDDVQSRAVLARVAGGPLRRNGCLRVLDADQTLPLSEQPIRLAPELASFLLGVSHDTPADGGLLRVDVPEHPMGRADAVARIRAAFALPGKAPVLVAGPDAVEVSALALGRGLVLADARAADETDVLARTLLVAGLESRAACLHRVDPLDASERMRLEALIATHPERLLLCAESATAVSRLAALGAIGVELAMPSLAERRDAWMALAGGGEIEEVAAKFRLSVGQIARAVDVAKLEARLEGHAAPGTSDFDAGARRSSSSGLGERATRLEAGGTWSDLVLADRQLDALKSISSYVRNRDHVLFGWGYEGALPGRHGLSVLFAGEPGTGKTMAARVLAADLGLELFSVDLATVVSKYVGETEQNLERIFAAADGSNAILFFDEADALFGRRSEVSDARDRYANIEVAYLLQRIEAHPGAVILATNLLQNIDDAFRRRLDFVIDFRFPDTDDRRRLWALAIPSEAPTADDIDLDFLAHRFKLSGGSIRNCSLAAAFEAAAAGQPVRMAHLVRAVAAEYTKLGRLTVETDFGPYHAALSNRDAPTIENEPSPPPARQAAPQPARERVRIGSRIEEL